MKAKKAISRVLAAAVASAALFPLSACSPTEADRSDGVVVSSYTPMQSLNQGARASFTFEGCTITVTATSGEGYFYIDQFQDESCTDWDRLPVHNENSFIPEKQAYPEDMPVHFENQASIQWIPTADRAEWWDLVAGDYVVAVAEKNGYLAGYAIVHIQVKDFFFTPTIVANKEFPAENGKSQDVDREWLDERIQTLITEYETAEEENGGQTS